MTTSTRKVSAGRPVIAAVFLLVIGALLLLGGGQLLYLGGSPYYAASGIALLISAGLIYCRRRSGYALYALFLVSTLIWGVWEVGLDMWGLFARLAAPIVVAIGLGWGIASRRFGLIRATLGLLLGVVLVGVGLSLTLSPALHGGVGSFRFDHRDTDWPTFAHDLGASRHADIDQITPANVGNLKPLWTYRTGDMPGPRDKDVAWSFEATPIKVGNRLFLCTAHSQVQAIDAETGRRLWVYDPHARLDWMPMRACRSVAYFRAAAADRQPAKACAERILAPIVDGRIAAIDAVTGRPCAEFGHDGLIDLRDGLGKVLPGYYYSTSGPLVVGNRFIVGAFVMDGATLGEPSGVIRAFDATTGKLDWAWDLGDPDHHRRNGYTPGTPNAWPPLTADPALGLVYVPLGNATPDFFGAHRSALMEHYNSSLVALDLATGQPRWSFQTTHHDLWDQDIPAQPTLFDLPTPAGLVPALVQPTKRGELFVLDRRNGKPLLPVVERPAPQGAAPGDFTSPTQPYSVGMPSLLGPRLSEASTWGITPLDQLWCRIKFRQLRYDGPMTPPSVRGSLSFPGSAGIFSWGGVSVDPDRHILVANSGHTPFITRLIPRAEANKMGLSTPPNSASATDASKGSAERASGAYAGLPQVGTPYAAQATPFLSPLMVPCIAPPWGSISGIDLGTHKLLWQKPFGTSRDTGPLGLHVGLPLPIGVPSTGGPITLASGVTFIAAAQDQYLRAYDSRTGAELWHARLPAGGQATPMTYMQAHTGRQIVVIAAGGQGGLGTAMGDYVVAFALDAAHGH